MSQLTIFDAVFLSFIFITILVAIFRGFIKDFSLFIILILSIIISHFCAPPIISMLANYYKNKLIIVSMVQTTLFAVAMIILRFSTNQFVSNLQNKMPFAIDKSLAIAFAILKSLFYFSIITSLTIYGYHKINIAKQNLLNNIKMNSKEVDKNSANDVPEIIAKAKFINIINVSSKMTKPISDIMIAQFDNEFKNLSPDMLKNQIGKALINEGVDKKEQQELIKKIDEISSKYGDKINDSSLKKHNDIKQDQDREKLNELIDKVSK